MTDSLDPLHDELARTDAAMAQVIRHAGQGLGPELERELDTRLRRLRAVLPAAEAEAADAAIEAAKRVVNAAEPEAPLLMLALARDHLSRVVQRSGRTRRRPHAA